MCKSKENYKKMGKIYQQKDHREENANAQPHSKLKKRKLRKTKCFLMYQIGKTQSCKISSVNKCSIWKYVLAYVKI